MIDDAAWVHVFLDQNPGDFQWSRRHHTASSREKKKLRSAPSTGKVIDRFFFVGMRRV